VAFSSNADTFHFLTYDQVLVLSTSVKQPYCKTSDRSCISTSYFDFWPFAGTRVAIH